MAKFETGDWVVVQSGNEIGTVAKVLDVSPRGTKVFNPAIGEAYFGARNLRLATDPERLIGQRAQPGSDADLPKAAGSTSIEAE